MNIFDRKINFDALLKFSHITPSTQQHLKKVYASFALCMFVAAAGAYVHVVTHFLQAGLLSALGSLGLMIWLMATPHSHETEQKRLGLLAGFAFLTGVGLGPALELCIAINPSILPTAFMGTAMIFTCFTLSALYARRRSYLFLGGKCGLENSLCFSQNSHWNSSYLPASCACWVEIERLRAARVAQRFSATFSPGCDPGDPGSSRTSGSLRGACFSLCLVSASLSLSLSLSLMKK
uniref:Bax inhibitor 1 n=1 Tax=Canis lupus familiaris TaxID=9615 RepID=A0A8P0PN94_CANLF